jgi:hypothetical protein
MASEPSQQVTPEQLMALRTGPDPLRSISELLQLKKMGPADHIRTKHEIKTFLETGGPNNAAELFRRSQCRLLGRATRAEHEKQSNARNIRL